MPTMTAKVSPRRTIYADYQATTPLDPRVFESMTPYWGDSFGNPHASDHIVGWRAAEAVDNAASSLAGLIGADHDEIIFTSGATEANNLALFGLGRRGPEKRRRILVSAIEHKCVLSAARELQQREGFTVVHIPVDGKGFVDLNALDDQLDDTVLAVSIMAVNNEVGTIQDIPRIAAMLDRHGIVFHCDAAQSPCAMGVAAFAEHTDMISLSAHKAYGPQGIGALYIRRGLQDSVEPLTFGGGQQRGLRSGTVPTPLCVGMAAAFQITCLSEGAEERQRVRRQRDEFISLLGGGVPVSLNGPDDDRRHPGNANLCFDGFNATDILGSLQPYLAASTGAACTSGMAEPSHVLRALGCSAAQADGSIRFSFGRFTSDDDISEAARLVTASVQRLRDREGRFR